MRLESLLQFMFVVLAAGLAIYCQLLSSRPSGVVGTLLSAALGSSWSCAVSAFCGIAFLLAHKARGAPGHWQTLVGMLLDWAPDDMPHTCTFFGISFLVASSGFSNIFSNLLAEEAVKLRLLYTVRAHPEDRGALTSMLSESRQSLTHS